jgi:ribosomal protein L20A (L18A)
MFDRKTYIRKYMKQWRKNNHKYNKELDIKSKHKLKDNVFEYLGGYKCVKCGCTNKNILEINHINLGGQKEYKIIGYWQLLRNIIKNKRKKEFDILCRVCNASHYCEKMYGIRHDIKLSGCNSSS